MQCGRYVRTHKQGQFFLFCFYPPTVLLTSHPSMLISFLLFNDFIISITITIPIKSIVDMRRISSSGSIRLVSPGRHRGGREGVSHRILIIFFYIIITIIITIIVIKIITITFQNLLIRPLYLSRWQDTGETVTEY